MINNSFKQSQETHSDDALKKCQREAEPHYNDLGFFTPRLRSINYLSIGRSRIISSPITITLELLFRLYIRMRDFFKNLWMKLTPKHMDAPNIGGRKNSHIIGQLVFAGKNDINKPIHNIKVVFWARTWLFQWRKLAEGVTDHNGEFNLAYSLEAAKRWKFFQHRFEIYQTDYRYDGSEKPKYHYTLFKSQKVSSSELVGMRYNLRTIQLFYWEYRTDSDVPRVVIKDHDKDAPQYYSQGRQDAMNQQIIPIELTKLSHIEKLNKDPNSLSIKEIQDDYPINLTVCMERKIPGITRGDNWFGQRMMNGMYAATFIQDKDNPQDYWTRLYGACDYDINNTYAFPSAHIKFSLDNEGYMQPKEIIFKGSLTAKENNPNAIHQFTPADGEKWVQAKRVARVTGALATELDDHFAGTHLVTEQYAIAAYRNLRLSPIAALLFPHLKEVVLINHSADSILIGPAKPAPPPSSIRTGGIILWLEDKIQRLLGKIAFETGGYIPQASALTAKGISQRVKDLMGVQDWKNWQPMEPLSEVHYFARAQNAYWELLCEYVDECIDENIDAIAEHWYELYCFSEDLVNHSVPLFLSNVNLDELNESERQFAQERLEWYKQRYNLDLKAKREKINGQVKVVSPITKSPTFNPDDVDNLKAVCRYCIMISTFMHSFVNEHQYDDIGEVLYNSLGLRFGDGEDGIMAPESDTRISPDLLRSTQMMWFSNLLSRTEYGFIERNEEGDINPKFVEGLKRYKDKIELGGKGVLIKNIESRTNI